MPSCSDSVKLVNRLANSERTVPSVSALAKNIDSRITGENICRMVGDGLVSVIRFVIELVDQAFESQHEEELARL